MYAQPLVATRWKARRWPVRLARARPARPPAAWLRLRFGAFPHGFPYIAVLEDEVPQLRIDNGAPAAARKNTVMAALFRREMLLVLGLIGML